MQNVRVASKEDIPFETLSLNETTDLLVNARVSISLENYTRVHNSQETYKFNNLVPLRVPQNLIVILSGLSQIMCQSPSTSRVTQT